jgi:molybdopterin synthase catalytic subunit/molybdopterin converting factor small subunit
VSERPIRVQARCFAILRDVAVDRCELPLSDGATLDDAWGAMVDRYPGLAPHRPYVRAARDGRYADWDEPLADGDTIAFLPPVSGGATSALSDGPIDVAGLERSVADPGRGARVTFIGRARDLADDGRAVIELEYEVYPEMAESVLAQIAVEAGERWDAAVAVVHRHGVVPIGEAAVAIVTAAVHRAEAYEANRFVIEAIKERLPIWKRERFADGSEWKRPGA